MSLSDNASQGPKPRVLVGGVGYRYLRDGALGPYFSDRLERHATEDLEVEDLSYHAVGLSQNLQERPPYDRLVLVAAVNRGRPPGTVEAYRWDGALPERDAIQERVADAAMGSISLDTLLIVCGALGGLPDDVRVVEVEPADEGWGEGFSPVIDAKLAEVEEKVWSFARP